MFRYDALWREAAAASSGRIHCVTFEGLKTELKKNVVEIVDFLGLENVDIDKVVEGSKFKSHDKDFNEAAKITDTESKNEKIVKVEIKRKKCLIRFSEEGRNRQLETGAERRVLEAIRAAFPQPRLNRCLRLFATCNFLFCKKNGKFKETRFNYNNKINSVV